MSRQSSVKMAERKKGKKRKEEYVPPGEVSDRPTSDEEFVAMWMRKNVPIKKTKFLNHNVEYFTARRAVDALMESKWVTGQAALFKTREEIVDFLNVMLQHKFFHRARKVPVSDLELKGKKREKKEKKQEKSESEDKDKNKDKGTDAESSVVEGKEQQPEKEKRKKKVRLDMHNDQRFIDSMDAYVWIYDPIPFYYWIIGAALVLGAIGICLFPLWPSSVRLGVYYLSVAAAGFLVAIIVLAVIRLIVFCAVWALTMGKHHLWILPNLTEDVGFFASFWPLYAYEYRGDGAACAKKKDKERKKKSDKDSDAEEEAEKARPSEEERAPPDEDDDDHKPPEEAPLLEGGSQAEALGASESESESSQRSSTGKDFEIVNQDELDS